MKRISEVIARLQAIQDRHGDLLFLVEEHDEWENFTFADPSIRVIEVEQTFPECDTTFYPVGTLQDDVCPPFVRGESAADTVPKEGDPERFPAVVALSCNSSSTLIFE